jgi:hypothetical protein
MGSFVCVAPHLRTVLAAHVPLKLMDRCSLGPADHVKRDGLMRVEAEAPHFEIEVARVQRVTQCRRWLRGSPEAEHALVPSFAREPIGLLAGLLIWLRAVVRADDARSPLGGFGSHIGPTYGPGASGRGDFKIEALKAAAAAELSRAKLRSR